MSDIFEAYRKSFDTRRKPGTKPNPIGYLIVVPLLFLAVMLAAPMVILLTLLGIGGILCNSRDQSANRRKK